MSRRALSAVVADTLQWQGSSVSGAIRTPHSTVPVPVPVPVLPGELIIPITTRSATGRRIAREHLAARVRAFTREFVASRASLFDAEETLIEQLHRAVYESLDVAPPEAGRGT
jgi:hypothetical protein